MATLKDVAKEAGVSIATVSHYLNNTRYVSPQLVDDIKKAIQKTGYKVKPEHQDNEYKVGRQSEIAIVIPGFKNTYFSDITEKLAGKFYSLGYQTTLYVHHNDDLKEASIITNLLQNKRLA